MKNFKSTTQYSNASRREFIRMLGLAGAAVYTGGLIGCLDNGRHSHDQTLKYYGIGTLKPADDWSNLKKELGITISFQDNGNNTGPIVTNMLNGNAAYDFDFGGTQGGIERELAKAGKILPWDMSKIPNWDATWDWAKKIPNCFVDGKQYGIPHVVNADSVLYLPEKLGTVDSYEVIFDPKLKGKTSMEDAWINSVIFAAIYLKENSIEKIDDPGDLSESELGIVMEFLIKKKKEKQFKTFWNGWEDGVRLMTSGEVYAMTGWEPIVYTAQQKGLNVKYAVPREGYEGWSNDLILHVGAGERGVTDLVHQYVNWELGGYYGCAMAKERGYIVPNNLSLDYAKKHKKFDVEQQAKNLEHVNSKFTKSKVYWQNTRPKNYRLYEEWWSKLRNA